MRGDRRQHLALEREILGHRLDHEVAALDRVQRVGSTERRAAAASRRALVAQAEPPYRGERLVDARLRGLGMAREAVHAMAAERVLGCDLRAHQPGTDDDDIHERRS